MNLTQLLLFLFLFCNVYSSKVRQGPIDHFVVLMMENRAFDHMLGFMKTNDNNINGLNGNEYNFWDPDNISSQKVYVTKNAQDVCFFDFIN